MSKISSFSPRMRLLSLCALLFFFVQSGSAATAAKTAPDKDAANVPARAVNAEAVQPAIVQDKGSYLPGEIIHFTGSNWKPGEVVTIVISSDESTSGISVQAIADEKGAFAASATMPMVAFSEADEKRGTEKTLLATATGSRSGAQSEVQFAAGHEESDAERMIDQETYWNHRLTYPTGNFNPEWVRRAVQQDARIKRAIPAGKKRTVPVARMAGGTTRLGANPELTVSPATSSSFLAVGPAPEHMTGCSGCYDYGTTEGRINDIVIDPTTVPPTTTNGNIVAYAGSVGGGVWKTTNCCLASTSWTVMTDDPLISTTSIDSITIDPNNHNTVYAGTGDLNYGSFSMGSQGLLKSTDGGNTWTTLGASVFGPEYSEPSGNFPQYNAIGKVRVDPNNSSNVVVGTKEGLYFSYDGGVDWSGPCYTNSFAGQRQDITGLELTNMGGGATRIIAAVGVRGFATTVQYDLGNNGANGLYSATMPESGCASFSPISTNSNGFVFGTAVSKVPYATGAPMNADSGTPYVSATSGNQLGRIDIAVAPSNPMVIYAQVQSIAINTDSGCGSANGCQLGTWASTDGGTTWSFLTGSSGGSLPACASSGAGSGSAGGGDYSQNWYDQGIAVDPNNADRVFINTFETFLVTRTGSAWYDLTCGYNGSPVANHVVHVDHHAQVFVPGSSDIYLVGDDGGIHGTTNASTAVLNTARPTWFNMDTGINAIEFYSGDLSGNFATSAYPQMAAGAQDNGPSTVTFTGFPTAAAMWQMGTGGDGFSGLIDPIGTGGTTSYGGPQLRFWLGNNSGGFSRCVANCTASGAKWTNDAGGWSSDLQSFILPVHMFHGGIPGGDDCPAAGASGGCGHLIAGTTRVWETINGNTASTGTRAVTWYVTNNPITANLTKGTLGNRSFINQVKYSPKYQSVAIVGTNDANVQIGFNLGTGTQAQANWVDVTGGNTVLPNRPVMGIALDPLPSDATLPIGYAAVGGFNDNTPSTPGHLFRVVCTANCASFTWTDKSGNLPDIPVDSVIVNPNFPMQVYAGTDFGLYYTDDITANPPVWNRFNNGLPNVMIWDMAVDRGATTLALWTRSRGAYVWPLPTGPENPLPTILAVAPVSGSTSAPATLTATLSSGGNPVSGQSVSFSLNGTTVGSATTNASGVATLNVNLNTITPGDYPSGVGAKFAGTTIYASAAATADLNVEGPPNLVTTATLAKQTGGYLATVTIKNSGTGPAQNVQLTTATLGSASGSGLPQSLGTISAGATVTTTVSFPASAGASGAAVVETYKGTYTGGTFGTSIRAKLP